MTHSAKGSQREIKIKGQKLGQSQVSNTLEQFSYEGSISQFLSRLDQATAVPTKLTSIWKDNIALGSVVKLICSLFISIPLSRTSTAELREKGAGL